MANKLNGSGAGFLSVQETNSGFIYNVVGVVAAGSYPAGGELFDDFIHDAVMKGNVKIGSGIKPDNVWVSSGSGFLWIYDRSTNTLRNWTAVAGGTPTEHASGGGGAYAAGEVDTILNITILCKKFASQSGAVL
jgi:hypothetical protein